MKYLVTGAAGFIGSAVVRSLLSRGDYCVTIDNLSTGNAKNIPDGCEVIIGDVFDEYIIDTISSKHPDLDAIIHIAGQSSGEISFYKPVYDLQTNVLSTVLLLRLAKAIGCKKFIYASSMSVYGDQPDPLCNESTLTNPKSFYAVGKQASENYMKLYSDSMTCTALRFFNVYGEGQNMENLSQGMASIFLAQAIKNKHVVVKGDSSRFRDFVHISDVVGAVLSSLDAPPGYNIYNVCTGVPTTVRSLITMIATNLPYDVTVDYVSGTPGDQHGIIGDYSRIHDELGWKPFVDIKSGIAKMVEWALSTQDQWSISEV